ncbi:hypothetical protein DPMN_020569 [Dreissena polymorpha]|uniref:Uncharacterized protein n=1 Tax=Dreissena polymorpha TaxID=45954 RepID=A0A9D4NH20_DREPO|nr:hypothetical protein DPMN_020569 [Dreissena polymorpha]
MISLEEPLSIFHDDWANNMTSRLYKEKLTAPLAAMFFNGPEPFLNSALEQNDGLSKFHENKANHVTARTDLFHEDLKIKLASKVLTRETNLPLAAMFFNEPGPFSNSAQMI